MQHQPSHFLRHWLQVERLEYALILSCCVRDHYTQVKFFLIDDSYFYLDHSGDRSQSLPARTETSQNDIWCFYPVLAHPVLPTLYICIVLDLRIFLFLLRVMIVLLIFTSVICAGCLLRGCWKNVRNKL
ncbi:hypothetical protein CRM22_007765 [Opisthorchis felineus]|uniref:Uncharacterized protein n=1 Tax=Opisthorchis felineus TaxID=147828 RepID=A0A4S2LET9_OPIFE|nr:hypothetical protein CRM22_007765 [Opisthorchis felineus]